MAERAQAIWDEIVARLRNSLPEASLGTWFASATPRQLSNGTLTIEVPDEFIRGGIQRRFRSLIEDAATSICGEPVALHLEISKDGDHRHQQPLLRPEERSRTDGARDALPLNPEYSFERFIRGNGNRLACAACRAVAEAPGKAYNPLFIYGSVGLGKTHLLQAIGNHSLLSAKHLSIVYTTSERFAIELINAIQSSTTPAFREKYRQVDVLLIDDVQFLQGKEATQEELFHTFNELYGSEKQIVLSSDRAPEDLSGLEERLVSRFRWGLVADIQPPDLETRIAILREKAANHGVKLDDSVLELIASRISSNIRALEGALIKAIAYAELEGETLTRSKVENVLPNEGKRERLTVQHVKEEVTARYHLGRDELEGTSRKKEIAQARHIAIYLSRELTQQSFPAIGRGFGNRDHSTIMHSYMRVKSLLTTTPLLYSEVREIEDNLRARYIVTTVDS
jgi:chromosomal replication initiator protein